MGRALPATLVYTSAALRRRSVEALTCVIASEMIWGRESNRMQYTRLWSSLALVLVVSFVVLGYYGGEIYRQAPPVPARVVTADSTVVFTGQEIRDGQNVWQSLGGQEVG